MSDLDLVQFDHVPDPFWLAGPQELFDLWRAPVLMQLGGLRKPPLFVSIMLHGNEHTGFYALKEVLKKYRSEGLPRELIVLIGNPEAAKSNERHTTNQPDFNRLWDPKGRFKDTTLVRNVRRTIHESSPLAIIDIHNNTGRNPLYSYVTAADPATVAIASRFSKHVVVSNEPKASLFANFGENRPSLNIECAFSGEQMGIEAATDLIEFCMETDEFAAPQRSEYELLSVRGKLMVDADLSFCFGDSLDDTEFVLRDKVDHWNFREVPAGSVWGWSKTAHSPISFSRSTGNEDLVTFSVNSKGEIVNDHPFVPAMLTLDRLAVKQDCLGYALERNLEL